MEYTRLGQTDLRVSRIALGTWSFGGDWGNYDAEESKRTIRTAFGLGINFFDTAQAYGFGASEQLLGEALRDEIKSNRDSVVLATKGGLRKQGDELVRDASAAWLRQGVESSLRALGTDYVDLYQVHWPDLHTPFQETARALDDLVTEGKIRYVGVSNFDLRQMAEFEQTRKIDALQPPYHLFRRDAENTVFPYTLTHGIGVLIYGPLAHGLLTGKYGPNSTFPLNDWRSKSSMFAGDPLRRNLEVVEKLQQFAGAREMSVGQLAIAWTLANPAVDVAIVGARRPRQIEQSAPAARIHLSTQDRAEIDAIMADGVRVGGPAPEAM
jgi:aryl-alcohol dehydrogenase-like predicted oxidoreductase